VQISVCFYVDLPRTIQHNSGFKTLQKQLPETEVQGCNTTLSISSFLALFRSADSCEGYLRLSSVKSKNWSPVNVKKEKLGRNQKLYKYLKYNSVCPLVRIGTPPHPSPASECVLPRNQSGGGHTRLRVRGWEGPNLDDLRRKIARLVCE
jgi:hypothetical protein